MKSSPVALSLFSGLGGMDIGFERAGFKTLGAVEINRYACQSLRLNRRHARKQQKIVGLSYQHLKSESARQSRRPHWIEDYENKSGINSNHYLSECIVFSRDIHLLSNRNIDRLTRGQEIDLVYGGAPCQSFSMSGKRKSLDDDRGQLFLEFARVARYLKPKYIVFENVKGILSARGDHWRCSCLECGNEFMPSFLEMKSNNIICPECYGNAVDAPRLIASSKPKMAMSIIANEFRSIGYSCSFSVFNCADLGAPQKRERVIMIASRLDQPTIYTHELLPRAQVENNFQKSLFTEGKLSDAPPLRKLPPTVRQILEESREHLDLIQSENACLWLRNVVRPHAEPVTWSLDLPAPTVGAHQAAKLAIAPNGVPEEQIQLQQWHTKGGRLGKGNQLNIKYSFLSDRVLLALQSFPPDWAVSGTRMERAFQIGNAVPPILAEHIGCAIREALFSESTYQYQTMSAPQKREELYEQVPVAS
jgi:DNA (cytosine-5)-methyltransferase 1